MPQPSHTNASVVPRLLTVYLAPLLLLCAGDPAIDARNEIVTTYQRSIDQLRRGDLDAAMQMDTDDWISITVGQKPMTRQEAELVNRKYLENIKPPPGWTAVWKPDYEHNGTTTGIGIYDVKFDGDKAVVLCLVGGTRTELKDGVTHNTWTGSHVRDTWIRTPAGWKRRMHEKLTINERLIDGQPVK
jgi:hypothetical protein